MKKLEKVLKEIYDENNITSEDEFMMVFGKVMSEVGASLKEKELQRLMDKGVTQ